MATATLQSFNVFLTDRLTAAAVDIYGFVEKTIIDYQEEVYRAKMENQRLQRLLDLVYKPEIRLHRADSRQSDLPRLTQEVCAREQQIQRKCVVIEAKEEPVSLRFKEEQTEPWTASVETLAYTNVTDTQMAAVGERDSNLSPDSRTQGEHEAPQNQGGRHAEYEAPPQRDLLSQSFRASRLFKKRKMFSCTICCQAFLRKAELKSHLPSHTTKTLPHSTGKFTCLVCGRRVSNRSQMTRHMRTHTGEKPYGCSLCGNRYKLKSHIKEHARTHTGERPYTCHVCGKSFNRSSTMSKHAKIQHGEDMPFKCAQCNQRFPLLVVFKRHMRAAHDITFSV